MLVPQICDNLDWVEPSILSKGEGNDLQGICEGLDTALLRTIQSSGILSQLLSKLDLDGTATWNDAVIFDEASDNTEGVVEGSLSLVNDLWEVS